MIRAVAKTGQAEYEDCKQIILESDTAGIAAFVRKGLALARIKERKLWSCKGFLSFADCVQEEFGYKLAHAYRLIKSGKVLFPLGIGEDSPNWRKSWQEAHVRELTRLDPKKHNITKIVHDIETLAKKKGVKLTAEFVRKYIDKILKKKTKPKGTPPLERAIVGWSQKMDFLSDRLDQVRGTKGAFAYLKPFVGQKQRLSNAVGRLQRALELFTRHLPPPEQSD
jgi:hypothetical protein